MQTVRTAQELFWEGEFGNSYTDRNYVHPDERQDFFRKVLNNTFGVIDICELGANTGHNLLCLHDISSNFRLSGVEVNNKAYSAIAQYPFITAYNQTIQEFQAHCQYDLVFTCGVLIHIAAEQLNDTYDRLFSLSKRYVLINEYFNPTPVELEYRGHSGKLFKRDFAKEFMDRFPGQVRLVDYGFLWKHDNPVWDDTTWFLFEKTDSIDAL